MNMRKLVCLEYLDCECFVFNFPISISPLYVLLLVHVSPLQHQEPSHVLELSLYLEVKKALFLSCARTPTLWKAKSGRDFFGAAAASTFKLWTPIFSPCFIKDWNL
ncbi:uncharacterized protein A4U43_C04F6030 [Asparagus officinalis]|uniref:Uncharacterized protein n=1 Tax=Asparagus officinalis TaxID=4686 RepID=A0A5P1F3K0_ASPOF|nr:uncharacterized protein A4U43_C04F6030 [Asparagus officinalis]